MILNHFSAERPDPVQDSKIKLGARASAYLMRPDDASSLH